MVSINPAYNIPLGGVKIQVKKSDALRSLKILDLEQKTEPVFQSPQTITIKCPNCGEENEMKKGIKFCGSCGDRLPS